MDEVEALAELPEHPTEHAINRCKRYLENEQRGDGPFHFSPFKTTYGLGIRIDRTNQTIVIDGRGELFIQWSIVSTWNR
jgi:hypothetical protein